MNNTAMILGIIGGILGMIVSALAIAAGFVVCFLARAIPSHVQIPFPIDRIFPFIGTLTTLRGLLSLTWAIIALVAATMVKRKSPAPGIALLIAGIAGFLFLFIGFLVPGVLIIIAGVLALTDREEKPGDRSGNHRDTPAL
ncbi:MAG TPA: hypothetical protein VLH40_09890 [Atribacteraceae bacterium]|nr:hypothetical protein [Atribacteraceae bacterium]